MMTVACKNIENGKTTRKMCNEPEGIMEQEGAYLAALASAVAYQIEGDELTLMNADGLRVATFTVFDAEAAKAPIRALSC